MCNYTTGQGKCLSSWILNSGIHRNFFCSAKTRVSIYVCSLVQKPHLCPHLTKLFVTYTYLRKLFQKIENQPNVGYCFITSQLAVCLWTPTNRGDGSFMCCNDLLQGIVLRAFWQHWTRSLQCSNHLRNDSNCIEFGFNFRVLEFGNAGALIAENTHKQIPIKTNLFNSIQFQPLGENTWYRTRSTHNSTEKSVFVFGDLMKINYVKIDGLSCSKLGMQKCFVAQTIKSRHCECKYQKLFKPFGNEHEPWNRIGMIPGYIPWATWWRRPTSFIYWQRNLLFNIFPGSIFKSGQKKPDAGRNFFGPHLSQSNSQRLNLMQIQTQLFKCSILWTCTIKPYTYHKHIIDSRVHRTGCLSIQNNI